MVLNGELLDSVDCFKYLRLQVPVDGRCERDVLHRMNEGYKAWAEPGCIEYRKVDSVRL